MSWVRFRTRQGPRESGMVPARAGSKTLRKMKNWGNEAKEYLKTKDITFSIAADLAVFARKLAQIELQNGAKDTFLGGDRAGF